MTSIDHSAVGRSLASWRADSLRPARAAAVSSARVAMFDALSSPRPSVLTSLLGLRARRHRGLLTAALAGMTACVALGLAALGWDSPAGSPLHTVRVARERVELVVPGSDALSLRLGFAESRLADAKAGRDPAASLSEAASLLTAVHDELPSDHSATVWTRWTHDESELASLEAEQRSTPSSPSASPSPSSGPGSHAAPGAAGSPSTSPEPSEHQGTGASAVPSERGEGSGSAPSPTAPGGEREGGPQPSASAWPSPTLGSGREPWHGPSPSPMPTSGTPAPSTSPSAGH